MTRNKKFKEPATPTRKPAREKPRKPAQDLAKTQQHKAATIKGDASRC